MPNGDPTCSGPTGLLNRRRRSASLRRSVPASRASMQATSLDQTEKEIFVVVSNSGCRDPAPTLACWPVHAQAPRVEPFSRTKDKSRSTEVRRCRCVALAHRTCSGSPGPRGHRRWGRFERRASRSDHNYDFTSSECCDLCGNWIASLDFRGSIVPFLSKALAKLALPSVCPCQLPISRAVSMGRRNTNWKPPCRVSTTKSRRPSPPPAVAPAPDARESFPPGDNSCCSPVP